MTTTQVLRDLFHSVNDRFKEAAAEAERVAEGAYTDTQIREAHSAVGRTSGLIEAMGIIQGALTAAELTEAVEQVASTLAPPRRRFGRR